MNALRKLTLAACAALLALLVVAAPALAAEPEAPETQTSQEEGGRPSVVDTPRDQVGLLLYAALAVFAVGGAATFRRQLKGERPQASGEFRWR